ncbi:MAG TPA: type II toxin-antitoxin system RelE/ParE family toxin [Caulobacteraceae bacterium]|nr:type II toxin-antitoxin system RelE/ParE family toxin [Caulobacteraceae bacterium]
MKRLVVAEGAKADLREIRAFSREQWGREQAKAYVELIISRFAWLMLNARRGARADQLIVGVRRVNVRRHAILYLEHADSIEVLRVLHQQMDFATQLGVEPPDDP